MIEYLRKEDVPRSLEAKMVSWAEFGMRSLQEFETRDKILRMAPPHLQRQLTSALHRDLLARVRGVWGLRGGGRG